MAGEGTDFMQRGAARRPGADPSAPPLDAYRNALQAQMLDSIGQAVIATDLEGRVVYANRMADELYGWPRGGMLGLPIQQVTVPPGAQEQAGVIMREMAAGGTFSGEFEVRRRDGSTFPAHVTNTHFRTDDGRVAGIVGISFDLAERKQWERRIGEVHDTLRMINRCAEVIALAGTDGGRFFRDITAGIAAALQACAGFVAAPLQQGAERFRTLAAVRGGQPHEPFEFALEGTPFQGCDAPVLVLSADGCGKGAGCCAWPLLAGSGAQTCVAVRLTGVSGRTVGVAVFAFDQPLQQPDTVAAVLRMFAARVAAELERREADTLVRWQNRQLEQRVRARTRELELANRELEAFSASVSHDLRAPLAAIGGFADLLQSLAGDTLPERGAHALRRIRAGARQMESLIEGLLSLARVSRDELRLQDVDLSGLAEDVVAQLQAAAPRQGVEVRIQPGLHVRGDECLLRQVLANLLGNAWKFTSLQPTALIEFGSEDGEYFVRDDGPGFDMAYAHRLFGTFQRLHTASEFPGEGIGLATVRRVVERHGGTIRGESGPQGGACFRFRLAVSP